MDWVSWIEMKINADERELEQERSVVTGGIRKLYEELGKARKLDKGFFKEKSKLIKNNQGVQVSDLNMDMKEEEE